MYANSIEIKDSWVFGGSDSTGDLILLSIIAKNLEVCLFSYNNGKRKNFNNLYLMSYSIENSTLKNVSVNCKQIQNIEWLFTY